MIALSFWKKWLLYVFIIILSAINTSLHAPIKLHHEGRAATYSGTVISEDHREHYVKLLINIDKAMFENRAVNYRIPVEFYAHQKKTFLGRKLFLRGRIRNPKYASQPNILSGSIVKLDYKNSFFGGMLYSIRHYIDCLFKSLFDNEHYDLTMGLVLGGSGRLTKDLRNVFIRAGVLHILAVSGLHVGFVCMFVYFFLLFIPVATRVKFLIVMLILLLYAGLTGFRPSVCRATVMAFLFGLALVFQRNVDGIHITNIAAILFLLISPLLLFNVGAQLSFAAVYGIFFLYPKIENLLKKKVSKRLYKFIIAPMAISFSAQLFIFPLLIYYFHRLPTLAVLSNLLIVPTASIVVFLLFLCLILGSFSFFLAQVIASCASIFMIILIAISKLFAAIPFSAISLSLPSVILLFLYFVYAKRFRKIAVITIIVLSILFSISELSDCVVVKTVSSGALITTPEREDIFVMQRQSLTQSAALLANRNIDEVDYLIARERYFSVGKKFFRLPDQLHTKQITFGNVIIDLAKEITVTFRKKNVVINEYGFQDSEGTDDLLYIIFDDKNMQVFSAPLYGSIIDKIIVDLKMLFAKLRLLF